MKVVTTTNRSAGDEDWACGDPESVVGALVAQLPKLRAIADTTATDNRRTILLDRFNSVLSSLILNILMYHIKSKTVKQ
jgi:hypothetical protein